jgi:hypothetical protein
VIHQRPILGNVGGSVKGDFSFAVGAEPRTVMNLSPPGTAGAVTVVTRFTTITEYHVVLVLVVSTQLAGSVVDRQSSGGHHGGV